MQNLRGRGGGHSILWATGFENRELLRKAFHLIDHSIFVRKLRNQCKLPASIINWIIDFLSDRSQRIKFASECFF